MHRVVDEALLRRKGIKLPKKCCDGGYKFDLLESSASGVMWILASCPVCRKQWIWNSNTRVWMRYEQAGGA